MKIQYKYDGEVFTDTYSLSQKLWKKKGVIIKLPLENKAEFWASLGVTYIEEPDPEPSEEEKAAAELEEAKRIRAAQVAAITVEVDGMFFDGDETAQDRMTRALKVADLTGMDSTIWVLANNTVATVTKTQMQQALSKAMLAQSDLWTKPYDTSEKEVNEDVAS